ncbi:MAG TPA: AAA family ATPase [Candidatus Tectomicrobia bacterium]|nr:AAA family ATPase [Candidatus Tectomicrobia bacterium]
MVERFIVGLDVKNEQVKGEFEKILASGREFHVSHNGASHAPDLLILELDDDRHKTFARVQALLTQAPAAEVFLTASHTEPEVLLNAWRAGVKEFIPQPLQREELEQALKRFKERHQGKNRGGAKNGRIVNVIGSKGGVGTTTLAVNLAVSLREAQENSSVVLLDLNTQFGDVALFLDMEPTHTLADIAKNLVRLDTTFLMSTLTKHRSGIYVLPSPKAVEEIGVITPESVQQTLALLQTLFDYVVVDSGHSLDDLTASALNMSQTVFLVSGLTIPVMRNTRRFLDIIESLDYPCENIKIVVNRYSKKATISLKDVEAALKQKVFWLIPNDFFVTIDAINKGEPISNMAPKSEVRKSLHKLAFAIMTEGNVDKKPSLFGRLFKSHA